MAYLLFYKLVECAKAIEGGNLDVADSLLAEIQSLASKEASRPTRKVVRYCAEALVRRVYGIRPRCPLPLLPLFEPFEYIYHPFYRFADISKHAIADAFSSGHKRLHIIDFSIMLEPCRWKSVSEDLKKQHGGLQSVRLTSFIPKLSKHSDHLRQERRMLIECAAELEDVNLEWRQFICNSPGDIVKCISKLRKKRKNEMVVVNWNFILHKLLAQDGAIEQVLSKVKDLKVDIMVIVEQEANLNSPDFSHRLEQSFQYYSSIFESLEKKFLIEPDYRKVLWELYFRRQMGNVMACEGIDRVERIESFVQWQHHLSQAGFCPVPQQLDKLNKDFQSHLKEFGIEEKDGHFLLCWYSFPLAVASVWKCTNSPQFSSGLHIMQDAVDDSEMASSSESEDDEANDPSILADRNLWSAQGSSMNRIAESAKIFDILEYTCHLHELPLAVTWISYNREGNTNSKGKRILCIDDNSCYANHMEMEEFVEAYAKHHLEEGQGIAGKALQSNIHIEHDISVLDPADCPFVDKASSWYFDLHAAFAIKLTSTDTCNDDYILEFFLPQYMKEISKQELLIDKVLRTLQKNCWNFWTVWGRELNEANGFEVRFEGVRTPNILPAVYRSSLLPLSNGALGVSETMALGTYDVASDQVEETHEPLEQEIGEQNAVMHIAPAFVGDNEINTGQTIFVNKRRKISIVWEGFNKHKGENGEIWAKCKYCKKQYRAESTRGTSNLHKHLKKCVANRQGGAEQLSSTLVKTGDLRTSFVQSNFVFDQERTRLDIARMMIKHGYPMDMVQHEFFKIFLKNMQPMFELYSQEIVEADILAIYRQDKEKLIKYFDNLSSLFCLTIELRKSDDKMMNYCCLTLHYLSDGWELKKRILAFRKVEYNYNARTVHEVFRSVLTEWSINKKVHFILLDIAPPNDYLVGELRSKLSDQVSLVHGDLIYASSFVQVLILLVQDGFSEIRNVLYKIRECIEYVNGTLFTRQKFQEAINNGRLQDKQMTSLDVPTRWDTTFLMLESALEFRAAFNQLEQVDGDFNVNPSMEEWNKAIVTWNCLKEFHKFASYFPTSIEDYFLNVRDVYKNLLQWKQSEHMYIRSMANRMKLKFDDYWGESNLALGISLVLNPCFKLDFLEYGYQHIYGNDAYLHLLRFRYNLTGVYHKYANITLTHAPSTSANNMGDVNCCASYNLNFDEWRKGKCESNSQRNELDQYLEQPPVNLDNDSNILAWWHANAQNFPILGKMARDFLAIPISTIISKSCLTEEVMKMSSVIDGVRPEMVEALICGKDWLESPKWKVNHAEHI